MDSQHSSNSRLYLEYGNINLLKVRIEDALAVCETKSPKTNIQTVHLHLMCRFSTTTILYDVFSVSSDFKDFHTSSVNFPHFYPPEVIKEQCGNMHFQFLAYS